MLPVREEDVEARKYQDNLATLRERILAFAVRRLVPHWADFAEAEEIAQSCVVALWQQYPDKRDLAEMVRIGIGVARHKIAQFHRDREKMPDLTGDPADHWNAEDPFSAERLLERLCARQDMDRLLLGMLKLPARCRELMRLKLIEQRSYDDIRGITGISGNIYETTRRCFQSLLRNIGGNL